MLGWAKGTITHGMRVAARNTYAKGGTDTVPDGHAERAVPTRHTDRRDESRARELELLALTVWMVLLL